MTRLVRCRQFEVSFVEEAPPRGQREGKHRLEHAVAMN